MLQSILRRGQMMAKPLICSKLHTTTSAFLPPANPRKNKEPNPFGINDDEDMTSLLVQGNVNIQAKPSSASKTEGENSVDVRLKKYESWVQQSEDKKNLDSEDTESVRKSTYGNVRLDRDNVPKEAEDYNRSNMGRGSGEIEVGRGRGSGQIEEVGRGRNNFKSSQKKFRNEHRADEEEGSDPNRMTAYEFLKSRKAIEKREVRMAAGKRDHSFEMEDVAEYQDYQNSQDESPSQNPAQYEYLDSHEIPKQYQMPDLNELTQGDMWQKLKKSIVFENEFLMAINKPYGIAFQGKSQACRHTLIQFLKEFAEHCKCEEVFPLHRIDKDTTGVLMFAKDKRVANVISQKFANRQVRKYYLAITKNCPQPLKGTIKIPIGEGKIGATKDFRSVLKPDLHDYNINNKRTNCREAITKFSVIKSYKEYAFLEIEPEYGLKHQIRAHLGLGMGCPILGDHKYSHRDRLAPQRLPPLMLHKMKVKQAKVRDIPIHLHCNQIAFDLSSEFTESKEPVLIHAKVPYYFSHSLKVLGLSRPRD